MTKHISVLLVLLSLVVTCQGNVVTKGAREIVEAIAKKGGKEATQELAEFGGKQAVQEVLEKASREGGDELVEKVIRYGKKYGVSAVKTIDNAPVLYVKALDELPENLVERALWAAQREPETVTRLLSQYGSDALEIAARSRGVGADIVTKLGNDGIRMSRELTEDQAIILARHADELAGLPTPQRSQVVDAIICAPKRVIDYMEKHPKVLFTAAGVATLVALKDDVLGRDEEVIVNPDGSRTIRKRGFIERQLDRFHAPLAAILVVIAAILGGWGVVKIRGSYRREQVKVARDEFRFEKEKAIELKNDTEAKNDESQNKSVDHYVSPGADAG